ncbi:MAG TPA: ADOP family duplicated permease [Steroidobacteraceae bacterium]|nr:ADOP family duplicated permease [Steroidobacteraceae bacterium]
MSSAALRRNPGFALAVLMILALGIGANTATLNLIYGYLLAPLPYPDAGRLVNVYFTSLQTTGNQGMSYPTYFDLRAHTTGMVDAGMYEGSDLNLVAGGQAQHVRGAAVSASLFTTLEVHPLLGRVFGPSSNRPGAAHSVVLSYRLWSRVFDRNSNVVGRVITLNDLAYTVIGVMPQAFRFPGPVTDLWLPEEISGFHHDPHNLTAWDHAMVARLAPGVTADQLSTQSQALLEREIAHFPDPRFVSLFRKMGMRIVVKPLRGAMLGNLHQRLILAQLATAMLLLLVWFNLANLFITRALQRRGELTVRRILGAQTQVLFRQLLAESLVPCLAGGLAGLLVGQALVRALLDSGFGNTALPFPLRDWGVAAGIALLLALASALVFSLAGLYFIHRQDLGQALREGDARSAGGRGEHRLRAALAITQLALAAALIGAGAMLTRSLVNLDAVELGFQPQHVLTFQVQIPPIASGLGRPDLVPRLVALQSALAQVPGVTAATVGSDVPFAAEQLGPGSVYPYPFDGHHTPVVDRVIADSGYFKTLDIRLLAGQPFAPRDAASRASSAVVDVQAARALFGTTRVVGREFSVNDPNDVRPGLLFRIVGIVAHARKADVDGHGSEGAVYVDLSQTVDPSRKGWSWVVPNWYVAVRTRLAVAAIMPAVRETVSRTLPGVPLYDVHSMTERVAGELAPRRSMTALVLIFALGALAVAAVGLYAVQSYAVGQRRPELGVRAALGADGRRLSTLVLREILLLLAIGLAIGLCAVVALGRALSAVLYQVHPVDPLSLVLVIVVLSVTAVLASWLPARRASRVPPMEALRDR